MNGQEKRNASFQKGAERARNKEEMEDIKQQGPRYILIKVDLTQDGMKKKDKNEDDERSEIRTTIFSNAGGIRFSVYCVKKKKKQWIVN